jgi:hypothetical protein
MRTTRIVLATVAAAALLLPTLAAAQTLGPLIPPSCLTQQRFQDGKPLPRQECGLPEMVELAVNASRLMLGLLGSVTFLVFIYGGFTWLTAGGNTERVRQGRKIFEGAIVGLVIVLSSWVIINFVIAALTGTAPGEPVRLFPGQGRNEGAPFQTPRE